MRALALAVIAIAAPASADPPKLQLEREPRPRHLRMRPRAAQAQPPATTPPARPPMPQPPTATATTTDPIPGLEGVRDVTQPVSFSINLGYQVDGARRSGRGTLGGPAPELGRDYASLRSYGFGEAFLSTRGVGVSSLATYFAARFQAARHLSLTRRPDDPDFTSDALASPIATWFERSGGDLRTGWAEVRDFLPRAWGLRNLRVRAGDQFVYGPWIVHMFGAHVVYEGPTLTAGAYIGQRRADYTRAQADNQPTAIGTTLKVDLRGLTDKVPIVVEGEYLTLTSSDVTAQPATQSAQLQVDWRPRRDVAVIGRLRSLDGHLANQQLEFRTRYKDVTNLVFEVMRRYSTDWRWDPTLVERAADLTEARRYLDLGPVLPQALFSARGGTLIAENLDLFARFAAASDLAEDGGTHSTFSAAYVELAGALEVRLRRQAAFGASILTRNTQRLETAPIRDRRLEAQPLPSTEVQGEDGFTELGFTLRLTLGARRFSALIEGYGRRTRYTPTYEDPILPLPDDDLRGGGRFTVDAWVGKRVRLFASYDLSTQLATAPEIDGYQSLRMVASGVY